MSYTNIFESGLPSSHFGGDVRAVTTEQAHRKIELQSPADLTYLIANVSSAAREKIDRDLPPDSSVASGEGEGKDSVGGQDAMRVMVEGLVDEYIRNTFRAAKDNLCINGMDSAELDAELAKAEEGEEIEPFNAKLAHKIQSLSSQIEAQTLALANLRRNAPQATAQRFHDSFTKSAQADDERLRVLETEALEKAKGTKVDVGEVQRLDEVKRTWDVGNERLEELRRGMEPTVARMEKAKAAVGVLQE